MLIFMNFLRAISGQNVVPLNYVCRKEPVVILPTYKNFIDQYVNRIFITGNTFETDNREVYAYLAKFISKNDTVESKIFAFAPNKGCKGAYWAPKDHYKSEGINTLNITKANQNLNKFFY